jgi:1-deoxy-D-xylulose 5-phosphate reductoisomerase
VQSVRDAKVGVIFDPQSLIQALTSLISEHVDIHLSEPDRLTENVKSVC